MKTSFQLPSIEAFRKLSLKDRTIVFRNWAATKEGKYDSISSENCALSQFSLAIGGQRYVQGSSYDIYESEDAPIQVIRYRTFQPGDTHSPIHDNNPRIHITTFGELVERLDKHIEKYHS